MTIRDNYVEWYVKAGRNESGGKTQVNTVERLIKRAIKAGIISSTTIDGICLEDLEKIKNAFENGELKATNHDDKTAIKNFIIFIKSKK